MKRTYQIDTPQDQAEIAQRIMDNPFKKPYTISASFEDDRTASQNRKLWATLRDIHRQVPWAGDPTIEDWKAIFMAALRGQRMFPGITTGMVATGGSTSRLNKSHFSDLIMTIYEFGMDQDVSWSEDSSEVFANELNCEHVK